MGLGYGVRSLVKCRRVVVILMLPVTKDRVTLIYDLSVAKKKKKKENKQKKVKDKLVKNERKIIDLLIFSFQPNEKF